MYDNFDIERIVFRSSDSGFYDLESRFLFYKENGDESLKSYVSAHENLHEYLNSVTLYGGVLGSYSYLSRNTEDDIYQERLNLLINRCRYPHEVFATFLSALNSKKNNSPLDLDPPLKLFIGRNFSYKQYYATGKKIAAFFNSWLFKYLSVSSTVIACMQTAELVEKIMSAGFEEFDIADLPDQFYPDSLLRSTLKELSEEFWEKVYVDLKSEYKDDLKLQKCFDLEDGLSNSNAFLTDFDSSTTEIIQAYFYKKVKDLQAEKMKVSAAGINDHLVAIDQLLTLAYQLVPFHVAKYKKQSFKKSDLTESEAYTLQVENEKVFFKEKKYFAVVNYLSEFDREEWQYLNCGHPDSIHFFIVFRTVEQLKQQYEFLKGDLDKINNFGIGVHCIRRIARHKTKEKEIEYIELILLETPQLFEEFLIKFSEELIICNLSYQAVRKNNSLYFIWRNLIQKYARATFLLDLSLMQFYEIIKKEYSEEEDSIAYFQLTVGEAKYPAIIFKNKSKDETFIALCSINIFTGFVMFLNAKEDSLFQRIGDSSKINPEFRTISSLTHIIKEEFYFELNKE